MPESHRKDWVRLLTRALALVILFLVILVLGDGAWEWYRLSQSHSTSPANACIANLKQIDGAKEQWALENKLTVGTPVDVVAVNSYLKNSQAPECPNNGTYSYHPVGTDPTCSLGATLGHTL